MILMDVDFKEGIDGMTAAGKLRAMDQAVILIFITNLAQMAVNGYMVDALDFIVKPLDDYSFLLKMSRAIKRVSQSGQSYLLLKNRGETVRINTQMIRYLEVDGHYVIYHSREGDFKEYTTLSQAEAKLNDPAYFRCDRGILVNLRFVNSVSRDTCYVDGIPLTIARTQKRDFMQAFEHFLCGDLRKSG